MACLKSTELAALTSFFIFMTVTHHASATPPHVVFIFADDYGYRDIGYHGSEFATPTLDSLAYNGVRLENYYVQPVCSPTRQVMLSGRYQIRTGLQHGNIGSGQRSGLPLDSPTLADKMKEAGYSTHAIGKWHLGFYKNEYLPHNRGFDTFYGYLNGGEDYYTHIHGRGRRTGIDFRENDNIIRDADGIYSTELFTTQAVDIIQNLATDDKLFMYLSFQAVHNPLQVPSRYTDMFPSITDANRKLYAGMVACMDEAVANVTQALKDKGVWNNTVLVFSSDNGGQPRNGASNWPLRGRKGSFWEGGVRSTGFVNSELLNQKGVVSNGFMHVSDWYPTFVNLAKGNLNGTLSLDGFDQWSMISEGQTSPRSELLFNIDPLTPKHGVPAFAGTFDTSVTAALRVGDMKILTGDPGTGNWVPPPDQGLNRISDSSNPSQNVWLFNITHDPNEMEDLSTVYPDTVRQLLDRLAYYNSTSVPVFFPDTDRLSNPKFNGGAWGPWVDSEL